MPLPNFFVIGAGKSGTTALYHSLAQHPDVYMSPVKEPMFFAYEGVAPMFAGPPGGPNGPRLIVEPHKYLALFAGVTEEHAVGEATASYLRSPTAARRIRRNLPDAKLVAVLRHPVARAYSSYLFLSEIGLERAETFEDALAAEQERMTAGWFSGVFHRSNGFYHAHLSQWTGLFPREQIRVYLYEDWRHSPGEMLSDLFGFLGVDPGFAPETLEVNRSHSVESGRVRRLARRLGRPALGLVDRAFHSFPPPPMREETRLRLLDDYREDITRLQTLLGRDLSHWLTDESAAEVGSSQRAPNSR
jgi:sulfotransferase family protein